MGSLGFMTPFAMEKMTKTLDQVRAIPAQRLCIVSELTVADDAFATAVVYDQQQV